MNKRRTNWTLADKLTLVTLVNHAETREEGFREAMRRFGKSHDSIVQAYYKHRNLLMVPCACCNGEGFVWKQWHVGEELSYENGVDS